MIVWDSPEAEQRNARQLLAERAEKLGKARRDVRWFAIGGATYALVLVAAAALAITQSSVLFAVATIAIAVGVWLLSLGWWWARDTVRSREEQLRAAQENHDRVFGTEATP